MGLFIQVSVHSLAPFVGEVSLAIIT
ncbi:unnamed protein product [Larinioides sclopetarius]|uniref:Uncharacterized protein n=1 Tax=Larinioides sclopetarius TaxID=280406 RepID=A0AAV2AH15_9ARAC